MWMYCTRPGWAFKTFGYFWSWGICFLFLAPLKFHGKLKTLENIWDLKIMCALCLWLLTSGCFLNKVSQTNFKKLHVACKSRMLCSQNFNKWIFIEPAGSEFNIGCFTILLWNWTRFRYLKRSRLLKDSLLNIVFNVCLFFFTFNYFCPMSFDVNISVCCSVCLSASALGLNASAPLSDDNMTLLVSDKKTSLPSTQWWLSLCRYFIFGAGDYNT